MRICLQSPNSNQRERSQLHKSRIPPAHLAHVDLLRLPPLTLFAPEDNQSSAIALEPTVFSVLLP